MKKILWTASSGGHLEELVKLKPLINKSISVLVTEESRSQKENLFRKVYMLPQINRKEKMFLIHFIKLFFTAYKIIMTERPDIIISTGALVTVPICLLGKMVGSKVIYIESFARITTLSLTGKMMYHFADVFIIQWPGLKGRFPKAKYLGGVF